MKVLKSTILSLLCVLLVVPMFAFSQAEAADPKADMKFAKADFKEMQAALKKTKLEVDLVNGTSSEQVVMNDKGEAIGVLGVEEVASQTVVESQPGEISALGSTALPTGVYKTFKVYWYAATVNYHFYTQVYRSTSTGLGQIVDAYDQWYVVIPPGVVNRDTLAITRKYETSSLPAEAKYSLNFTAPVSTILYIYGRVQDGYFISGGN
ncbi:hypothetical protein G3A_18805 [Bacillus sp. 17376]|uniref:DUF5626 domain-containing protein n=1 Tax=Mesobacillus boroniphilus JCM 21738 TaxID=1294265 RepID=W4RW28_9BACI|nr:hypothetical protein [Mesobacillus boroniphilus]ESU31046.1 hypothetical protein G3A_18805 [Bacillus sp. 17376]GAE48332.1 hypothetical protein JCM21738_5442 [Mesobacillus boroniphilus JCM 21738]